MEIYFVFRMRRVVLIVFICFVLGSSYFLSYVCSLFGIFFANGKVLVRIVELFCFGSFSDVSG